VYENEMNNVYILSGPAGIGKSTTAKALVKEFSHSAYLSGDYISHMHVNGRKKPWLCKKEIALIWDNILSLTKNFLTYGNDVVIDYVTFPHEAKWLHENLANFNTEVIYVVLWTDPDTLIKRDQLRKPEHQMGERCLILVEEFLESDLDKKHMLDTSQLTTQDIPLVLDEIIHNPDYRIEDAH